MRRRVLKGALVARDARGSSLRVLVLAGWAVITAVCGGIRAGLSRFAVRARLVVPRPRRKAPRCAAGADGCRAGFGPAPCCTDDASSGACRRCWNILARDAVRAGCACLRSGRIPDGKRRVSKRTKPEGVGAHSLSPYTHGARCLAGRLLMLASRANLTAVRNLVGTRPPHWTVDAPFKMSRSTRKASHAARGARGLPHRCGPSASRALDAFRLSAVAVLARHAVDAACLLGQRLVLARLAAFTARAARRGCEGARRTLDARTLRCRVLVLASGAAGACVLSFGEVCVLPRRAVATDPLGRACLSRGAPDAGVHGAQYSGPVAKRRSSAGAERALASRCRDVVVLADLAVLAAGGGVLPAAAGLLRPSAAFYTRARPLRRGRHVCANGAVRAGCIRASLSREPELRRRSSDNARTRADEMDGHSLPPFTDVARLLAGCLLVFAGRAGRTARRLLSGTRLTRGAVGAFLLPGRKPSRSARCA